MFDAFYVEAKQANQLVVKCKKIDIIYLYMFLFSKYKIK